MTGTDSNPPPNWNRRTRKHLVLSAGLLIVCRCVIAAGGVVTIVLIAARFGARTETDAYFIGRLIPVGLWMAFGRAFRLSFIPVYTRTLNNDG